MSKPTCADAIVQAVGELGVTRLFLVPGAHIDPLLGALARQPRVRPVICAHEQGAAYMADGYARITGGIGVCASIGGPGAANMLSAAATARAHGTPVLYLTGNPPTALSRSAAFQDGGEHGGRDARLFRAAVDCSEYVDGPERLPAAWARLTGRLTAHPPGPAHLMAPYDVLAAPADTESGLENVRARPVSLNGELGAFAETARTLLRGVRRTVVLAGSEFGRPEGAAALMRFAELYQTPVATTGDAKGLAPLDHPLHLGHFGYGGSPRATAALLDPSVEMVLVLGAELNERNSLGWHERFLSPNRKFIQVRPRPLAPPDEGRSAFYLQSDPTDLLWLLAEIDPEGGERLAADGEWLASHRGHPLTAPLPADAGFDEHGLHPARLVLEMRKCLPDDEVLFLDSGAHRFAAYHYWTTNHPHGLITAAKTAPTGWAIAAGIGAALSGRRPRITVLTGDGCMLMHGTELSVAGRCQAPVTFVVSNNAGSGNIYRRLAATLPGAAGLARLPDVNWAAFAEALGVPACRVNRIVELEDALRRGQEAPGPYLIDVRTRLDCENPAPANSFTSCSAQVIERLSRDERAVQFSHDG